MKLNVLRLLITIYRYHLKKATYTFESRKRTKCAEQKTNKILTYIQIKR